MCYFNFSFSTYFLSHTYKLQKSVCNTTDWNADQVFLFHVIFIFFVKNRILKKAYYSQLSFSTLP